MLHRLAEAMLADCWMRWAELRNQCSVTHVSSQGSTGLIQASGPRTLQPAHMSPSSCQVSLQSRDEKDELDRKTGR